MIENQVIELVKKYATITHILTSIRCKNEFDNCKRSAYNRNGAFRYPTKWFQSSCIYFINILSYFVIRDKRNENNVYRITRYLLIMIFLMQVRTRDKWNFINFSSLDEGIFINRNKTYVKHICMYYSNSHFVYLEIAV